MPVLCGFGCTVAMRVRRVRILAVVSTVVVAALVTVAGCGDGDDGSAAPTSASTQDQLLAFAECMRDEGVDVPDPGPDGGLEALAELPPGVSQAEFEVAFDVCGKHLPGRGDDGGDGEYAEQLQALAQCLREHGIDVPDPDPNNPGGMLAESGIDRTSQEFQDALQACQDSLPEGLGGE